jgi:PPE-repeat protein
MSGLGDAGAVDPATNHVLMRSGDLGASLLDAAAGHETIADMLLAEMAAMGLNVNSTAAVSWQGPGGQMMTMSAAEFILLCETASVWARVSMLQASEVAMAHSTALESMIPAEVVVTNRTTQSALVATNVFGIHSPAIAALEAQYQEFWVQNATARTGYGAVVQMALAALGTPAPFSPDAADPAGPAVGVAQAAATDGGQGALRASAKTMTQAGDATLGGGSSGSEQVMSSLVGELGGAFGQVGSSFGEIGGQLPSMLGQAPQLFSSMLGPLTNSVMGANAQTATALAPEAAGAIGPSLGGVGALGGLGGLGGAGGGAIGDAAVSSSFVRPASSFSPPTAPTLPGGWQGGDSATEAGAGRPAGMGGGGLYGAPGALGRNGQGSQQSDDRQGRTMQITARPSRGEQQRT